MIEENIVNIKQEISQNCTLVVVSKFRTNEEILKVYKTGHKLFAENRVQNLLERYNDLPKDIEWHLIGHLQSNKVKFIAPFIHTIQSVDSVKLLDLINKEAKSNQRTIHCFIQIHIAQEETKFGFSYSESEKLFNEINSLDLSHVNINGIMAMASNTDNQKQVKTEFIELVNWIDDLKQKNSYAAHNIKHISIGMSGDYKLAIACGGNMVRIGSAIFK